MRLKLVLAGIFLSTALTAFPQTAPSATQGGLPLTAGFGYSNFYTDWSGYESGVTLWLDWNLNQIPRRLQGLGIEVEARDLNFDRTGDNPKLREYSAGGGPIYHWRRFKRIDPYGKFLISTGHIEFSNVPGDYYTHDSRTDFAIGGGGDFRAWRNIWIRGDYEYQIWPDFLRHHAFNPKGLTVGASYDFGHMHSR
jgi:opacity protein-like surface antigen